MRLRLMTGLMVLGLALTGTFMWVCRVPAGGLDVPYNSCPYSGATREMPPPTPLPPSTAPATTTTDQQQQPLPDVIPVSQANGPMQPTPPPPPSVVAAQQQQQPKQKQIPSIIVNSRRIRLNYSISDVGPSGVSSVELWATRDGQTWQRYSNEPPPAGPLVVHVGEEGKYGFTIRVRSGIGLASPKPQTGDAPQLWVEVDETKPVVRVHDVHIGKGAESGLLVITWLATDAHLKCRPVTLSTATSRDGPWTPIATGLDNTGKYLWQMPKDLPYEFYVRVDVEDVAGNKGYDFTRDPIRIDLSHPRGTILGVEDRFEEAIK